MTNVLIKLNWIEYTESHSIHIQSHFRMGKELREADHITFYEKMIAPA